MKRGNDDGTSTGESRCFSMKDEGIKEVLPIIRIQCLMRKVVFNDNYIRTTKEVYSGIKVRNSFPLPLISKDVT